MVYNLNPASSFLHFPLSERVEEEGVLLPRSRKLIFRLAGNHISKRKMFILENEEKNLGGGDNSWFLVGTGDVGVGVGSGPRSGVLLMEEGEGANKGKEVLLLPPLVADGDMGESVVVGGDGTEEKGRLGKKKKRKKRRRKRKSDDDLVKCEISDGHRASEPDIVEGKTTLCDGVMECDYYKAVRLILDLTEVVLERPSLSTFVAVTIGGPSKGIKEEEKMETTTETETKEERRERDDDNHAEMAHCLVNKTLSLELCRSEEEASHPVEFGTVGCIRPPGRASVLRMETLDPACMSECKRSCVDWPMAQWGECQNQCLIDARCQIVDTPKNSFGGQEHQLQLKSRSAKKKKKKEKSEKKKEEKEEKTEEKSGTSQSPSTVSKKGDAGGGGDDTRQATPTTSKKLDAKEKSEDKSTTTPPKEKQQQQQDRQSG